MPNGLRTSNATPSLEIDNLRSETCLFIKEGSYSDWPIRKRQIAMRQASLI